MEHPDPPRLTAEDTAKIHRGRLGRYELFFRIGMGGMASVYLGRIGGEVDFERWVAIKQIHEHLAEEESFRNMFLDEARVAAQMSHPNLVQVTDVGLEEGRPFIVMEYVRGETLAQILKRCHRRSRKIPLAVAARIIACACEGLHHAHELRDPDGTPKGLVHRDLSPHNILISYEGGVKVADFGIAKAQGRSTHTRTGIVKGKPQYMSPEQATAKAVDRRSDVFSLGILLYEATLSRRLFKEESEYRTFYRITKGDVPTPRSVERSYPAQLERVVMRALAVKPADRYQTARDLQIDIERSLSAIGESVNSADVEAFMATLFADRIRAHEDLLAWARSNPTGVPPATHHITNDETGSSSMSIPAGEGGFDATDEPLPVATPARRSSRLVVTGILVGSLVAAVALGALAVQLAKGPGDDGAGGGSSRATKMAELIGTGAGAKSALDAAAPTKHGEALDAAPPADTGGQVLVFDASEIQAADGGVGDGGEVLVFELDAGAADAQAKHGVHRPQAQGTGTVSVMATPWCEVYLDGRRLGRTPIMRATVPAGRHTILLLPRGQEPGQRRTIRVQPGDNTPVSLNL
jgi:eukaryotic-like serine/threonine-protein kinase